MTIPTPGQGPWQPSGPQQPPSQPAWQGQPASQGQPAWQGQPTWQPAPSAAQPQLGRPLSNAFRYLAIATYVALGAIIVLGGYVMMLSVRGLQWVEALSSGTGGAVPPDGLTDQFNTASALYLVIFLVSAGCFIAWSYTLRRSDRVAPEAMRFAPGWTIGGWFVPILNFFRPLQVMTDLWRGLARPAVPHQAPGQPPVPGLIGGWWAAFMVMSVGGRLLIASVQSLPSSLETARRAFWAEIGVDALNIVAGVLAILVVRLITERAVRTPPVMSGYAATAPMVGQPWQSTAGPGTPAPWQPNQPTPSTSAPGYPSVPAPGPGYPPASASGSSYPSAPAPGPSYPTPPASGPSYPPAATSGPGTGYPSQPGEAPAGQPQPGQQQWTTPPQQWPPAGPPQQ